ncbi:hypothetical protein K431DRAFT_133024 [Polychaeton citri CBS 116435]|uniref:Uncharacterized protein n=1 Tax=Polychaeton citri CBS 116435 TaxID=1314669 RepID=A0A9P4UQQ8_9PEZI|nr:hypothetical protein K431DRAFT_133024 [Polychaeton citri CBS 116435]
MEWVSGGRLPFQSQPMAVDDQEADQDDDEDFYGDSEQSQASEAQRANVQATSQAGFASNNPQTSLVAVNGHTVSVPSNEQTSSVEQKKLENQRRAEALRAKLLQQRQNAQINGKKNGDSLAATPLKPSATHKPASSPVEMNTASPRANGKTFPSDALGVDAMMAEEKAKAETKIIASSIVNQAASERGEIPPHVTNNSSQFHTAQQAEHRTPQQNETEIPSQARGSGINVGPPASENYDPDLADWLSVTGYHNIQYRHAKLEGYRRREKEMKQVEAEMARLQQRLEELRKQDAAEKESMLSGAALMAVVNKMPPPILPSDVSQPTASSTGNTEPTQKRPRSVETNISMKVPRRGSSTFRIRGRYEETADRYQPNSRVPSLERRISYPSTSSRHGSDDSYAMAGSRSRDPSLERRQDRYYGGGARKSNPKFGDQGGPDYRDKNQRFQEQGNVRHPGGSRKGLRRFEPQGRDLVDPSQGG